MNLKYSVLEDRSKEEVPPEKQLIKSYGNSKEHAEVGERKTISTTTEHANNETAVVPCLNQCFFTLKHHQEIWAKLHWRSYISYISYLGKKMKLLEQDCRNKRLRGYKRKFSNSEPLDFLLAFCSNFYYLI